MNLDRAMFAFAGTMILISVLLTTFVGLNLLQSSFTGFCPAATILSKFGFKAGCAFK